MKTSNIKRLLMQNQIKRRKTLDVNNYKSCYYCKYLDSRERNCNQCSIPKSVILNNIDCFIEKSKQTTVSTNIVFNKFICKTTSLFSENGCPYFNAGISQKSEIFIRKIINKMKKKYIHIKK